MVQLHVIVKTPVVYVLLASTLLVHVASLVTKKDKTRQEKGSFVGSCAFLGVCNCDAVSQRKKKKKTVQKDERSRSQARACEPETTAKMPKP